VSSGSEDETSQAEASARSTATTTTSATSTTSTTTTTTLLAAKKSPVRQQTAQKSIASDSRWSGRESLASVDSDDDGDEVVVIQAFCGRPTRSGRIPRPAVRPCFDDNVDDIASALAEPPVKSTSTATSAKKWKEDAAKAENVERTAESPLKSSGSIVSSGAEAASNVPAAVAPASGVKKWQPVSVTLPSQQHCMMTGWTGGNSLTARPQSHTAVSRFTHPAVASLSSQFTSPVTRSFAARPPVTGAISSAAFSTLQATRSTLVPAITPHHQVDLSRLPPGCFVVVEAPSTSEGGTQQQALYHIFAIDQSDAVPLVTQESQVLTASVATTSTGLAESTLNTGGKTLRSV